LGWWLGGFVVVVGVGRWFAAAAAVVEVEVVAVLPFLKAVVREFGVEACVAVVGVGWSVGGLDLGSWLVGRLELGGGGMVVIEGEVRLIVFVARS
jgi:hypothetical protein